MDKRKKTITIYDIDGNKVKTFESVTSAAKFLGSTKGGVSMALQGSRKTCHGYIVREGEADHIERFIPTKTDKCRVMQCSLDGKPICEWASVHDAAKSVSTHPTNISKCIRGKKKTCKGFMWYTF